MALASGDPPPKQSEQDSSAFLSSPVSASRRITRSAARLASEASSSATSPAATPQQPAAHSVPLLGAGIGRKRKAYSKSAEITEALVQPVLADGRACKKRKPTEKKSVAAAPTKSRRIASMAKPGTSSSPVNDDKASASTPEPRRRNARGKKIESDAPEQVIRRRKRSTRRILDLQHEEHVDMASNEDADPDESDTQDKGSGEESDVLDSSRNQASSANEDSDDPFQRAIFGQNPGHMNIHETLRQLSGYMTGLSSSMKSILKNLEDKSDPSTQLVALQELSELLLVSNEDNLAGQFSPDQFVPHLVRLMQPDRFTMEENTEIMLMACRCMANMMEALPVATASVVYGGAVPVLCQKLTDIQYIDLAEQSLSTLEKISVDFPGAIVRAGGLAACLNYLDFFATSTQRTAVITAANCCKHLSNDSFDVVLAVMPNLLNVLASSDQRVVEQGAVCVSRIIESYRFASSKLDSLVSPDLLLAIRRLLQPASTNLIGPQIYTQFLRVLAITAESSARLSAELLKMNIMDTIYEILTGASAPPLINGKVELVDSMYVMQALIRRPKDQILESLSVISGLLPDVQNAARSLHRSNSVNERHRALLSPLQGHLQSFAMLFLPTLTDVYASTVSLDVRQRVLTVQLKMLSCLDPQILEDALRPIPYASFLASILSQRDHDTLVAAALQAVSILLNRLSDTYLCQFHREGVMSEVAKLADMTRAEHHGDAPEDSTEAEPHQEDVSDDPEASVAENDDEEVMVEDPNQVDEDDMEDNTSASSDEEAPSVQKDNLEAASRILHDFPSSRFQTAAAEVLQLLQRLSQGLQSCYMEGSTNLGREYFQNLAKHFDEDSFKAVTSAEILQSGMIETLINVLENDNEDLRTRAQADFLQAFGSRFDVLVTKLQNLLSRMEQYEITTVGSGDSRSMLSRQIRLRLVGDSAADNLLNNSTISIHAIATFKALDDYLRPRLSFGRRGDNFKALAALVAAAGMPDDQEDDEQDMVDSLTESVEDEKDPSAVNMEVAPTGKVIAREEDGTRIASPPRNVPEPSRMSYAAAAQKVPTDWHIRFSIDGQEIAHQSTIYRAISEVMGRNIWSTVHLIKFERIAGPPPEPKSLNPASGAIQCPQIMRLLKCLHKINPMANRSARFVNTKLTAKMNRQLEEPLIVASGCLPSWSHDLARSFPFIFPFETRYLFLQSTAFGYARSMTRWQAQSAETSRHHRQREVVGRVQRQKVRISRSRMLESACKVLEMYGSSSSMLEIEYFDEAGTGLGPTLEFYASISREFARPKTKMWRSGRDMGLFPAPMTKTPEKILYHFRMLGKFIARAMLDSRLIDVFLSTTFLQLAQHHSVPSMSLLASIDARLAASLQAIQNGQSLDEMGLDFTLPGYPTIELIENGSHMPVSTDNVNLYVERVLDLSLGSGVMPQIEAFKSGFSEVFSFTSLAAFTPAELVMLFGQTEENWDLEHLLDSIKADHGYTMDSKTVRHLLQVLSELNTAQRHDFLQFVTGSPKLPIGGFKSLNPVLTVVCKPAEAPLTPDDFLVSVMTCANYIKLPDYSSLDVLRTRLLTAITEGQGAFHLS